MKSSNSPLQIDANLLKEFADTNCVRYAYGLKKEKAKLKFNKKLKVERQIQNVKLQQLPSRNSQSHNPTTQNLTISQLYNPTISQSHNPTSHHLKIMHVRISLLVDKHESQFPLQNSISHHERTCREGHGLCPEIRQH
jgi:hypothetical protein